MPLLDEIALYLLTTVIVVPLFRRLHLSAVLGYLVGGIVIGPHGLGLVSDVERILATAEFGVVLLLFVIGLELQPSRLFALRRLVFGLGSAQVGLTTLVLAGVALLFGLPLATAVVAGFGLSLSSTPLVLQLLAERGELKSQYGRSAFSILLFQDLVVLPALVILPLLAVIPATRVISTGEEIAWRSLWVGAVALIIMIFAGRYLLRPVLRMVAEARVPEAFTAAALLLVVSASLLVQAAGLSMVLGAFVAGVLLADSEYRHELEASLTPFKGLLLGLFFMAVGMSVNLGLAGSMPFLLLTVTAGLMLIKALVVYAIARGSMRRQARSLALTLLADGEFAFVLFPMAENAGLLDAATSQLLILAVTFSMLLSPLVLMFDDRWLRRWFGNNAPEPEYDRVVPQHGAVVIAGFGRFGQVVARILRAKGIPFTALESSQSQVDFVRRSGNEIFYGDASRPELLRSAQLENAAVLLVAVADVEASLSIAGFARRHYPELKVFARARNRQHAFALTELGVHYIIRETFVSSLEMAEHVLQALGATAEDARREVAIFRHHDEATFAAQYAVKDDENKLFASVRESSRQLEQLFEADEELDRK